MTRFPLAAERYYVFLHFLRMISNCRQRCCVKQQPVEKMQNAVQATTSPPGCFTQHEQSTGTTHIFPVQNKPSSSHVSVLLTSSVEESVRVTVFTTVGPMPARFPLKVQLVRFAVPDTRTAPPDRPGERTEEIKRVDRKTRQKNDE